jgi:23S rRNA pseudouridine2605 synthase
VNRLIRVAYGPFQLGKLKPGAVAEIAPKVLAEQFGEDPPARKIGFAKAKPRPRKPGDRKRSARKNGAAGGGRNTGKKSRAHRRRPA